MSESLKVKKREENGLTQEQNSWEFLKWAVQYTTLHMP